MTKRHQMEIEVLYPKIKFIVNEFKRNINYTTTDNGIEFLIKCDTLHDILYHLVEKAKFEIESDDIDKDDAEYYAMLSYMTLFTDLYDPDNKDKIYNDFLISYFYTSVSYNIFWAINEFIYENRKLDKFINNIHDYYLKIKSVFTEITVTEYMLFIYKTAKEKHVEHISDIFNYLHD